MANKPKDYGVIDDRTDIPPYDEKGELLKEWPPPRKPSEKIKTTKQNG